MDEISPQVLERLINQFPDAELTSNIQEISEIDFNLQSKKHTAKSSLGGAVVIVITPDDKIILAKRAGLHSGWALPGGTVEFGEDFLIAFEREVMEEVGLEAKRTHLMLIEKKQFISPSGSKLGFILAVFCSGVDQRFLPKATANAKQENLELAIFEYSSLPESMILNDLQKIKAYYNRYIQIDRVHELG